MFELVIMIGFEAILFLLIIGFASLIITVILLLTGKKIDTQNETEQQIFDVKIFNSQLKLVPFLYLIIVLILFLIGIFSDFIINSMIGLIFAIIPFIFYWIFDYKKYKLVRKK